VTETMAPEHESARGQCRPSNVMPAPWATVTRGPRRSTGRQAGNQRHPGYRGLTWAAWGAQGRYQDGRKAVWTARSQIPRSRSGPATSRHSGSGLLRALCAFTYRARAGTRGGRERLPSCGQVRCCGGVLPEPELACGWAMLAQPLTDALHRPSAVPGVSEVEMATGQSCHQGR
jgi:hypothetical protein